MSNTSNTYLSLPSALEQQIRAQMQQQQAAQQQMKAQQMMGQMQDALGQAQSNQLNGLVNMLASPTPIVRSERKSARLRRGASSRAKHCVERGEELIGRIAFWTVLVSLPVIGHLADRVLARLASELDAVTDDVERWANMGTKSDPDR